jgi:hypothetical protein
MTGKTDNVTHADREPYHSNRNNDRAMCVYNGTVREPYHSNRNNDRAMCVYNGTVREP